MSKFTTLLATVLATEQSKIPYVGDTSTQRGLSVLKDEKAQNVIKRLFKDHVHEEDFSKYPALLQDIDAVFVKHGAKKGKGGESADNDVDDE